MHALNALEPPRRPTWTTSDPVEQLWRTLTALEEALGGGTREPLERTCREIASLLAEGFPGLSSTGLLSTAAPVATDVFWLRALLDRASTALVDQALGVALDDQRPASLGAEALGGAVKAVLRGEALTTAQRTQVEVLVEGDSGGAPTEPLWVALARPVELLERAGDENALGAIREHLGRFLATLARCAPNAELAEVGELPGAGAPVSHVIRALATTRVVVERCRGCGAGVGEPCEKGCRFQTDAPMSEEGGAA